MYVYKHGFRNKSDISQENIFTQNRRCVSFADRSMHVPVMRQRASHSNAEKVGHKLPPDRQASRTTRIIKAKGRRHRLSRNFRCRSRRRIGASCHRCVFCVHTPFENPRSCLILNTCFSRVLHVRHINGEIFDITYISLYFWKGNEK